MGVIGPLIGAAGFFGVLGLGVGAAIGAAIRRRAAELAREALDSAATPAGRTTSLPSLPVPAGVA